MKKTLKFGLPIVGIFSVLAIEEYIRRQSVAPLIFFGVLAIAILLLCTAKEPSSTGHQG